MLRAGASVVSAVIMAIAFPALAGVGLLADAVRVDAQAVPQPFPRPSDPQRPGQTRPQPPAAPPDRATPVREPAVVSEGQDPAAAASGAPSETMLGVPIYPGAQFLASYDAGQGQRYYLFGTGDTFVDVVNHYRTALRQRGDLVFDQPATHMFEVGRFREDAMAFPPGVTVKDYTWGQMKGYLNPKPGGQPARFPTIIQIVPVVP